MQLRRLFSTDSVKGSKGYLDSQKKYEVIRTVLYFGISLSLFVAGYLQTKDKANLLTIVAVLGCLPASKSAVSAVMYLRYKSLNGQTAEKIEAHCQGLACLYDMVFTSYKKNFVVGHLAVCGNTVCGYSEDSGFQEGEFGRHIDGILKMDGLKGVTVKIFTSLSKYTERLDQMRELKEEAGTGAVLVTLKSVAL